MQKNSTVYINKFALNYFQCRIEDRECTIDKLNDTSINVSSLNINDFFGSLMSNTKSKRDSINFEENTSLLQILSRISSSNIVSNDFSCIGNFISSTSYYYDIYFRKLKIKEEAVEILIYDITEVIVGEKIKNESKLNKMILPKITHEIKTPLLKITSIIKNIKELNLEKNGQFNNLDHINNLSYNTIFLINDINRYVSKSSDLNEEKIKINILEIINFSFNILKTLVETDEKKSNDIKTYSVIDDNLQNLTVYSNDTHLKQIILNLISNAFKFTKSGFIKIEAKFISIYNSVEISVEDTGIGIKEKDYLVIFNKKINSDQDYNTYGSGLGLSICKTLADALNHKITFESAHNEGSKFKLLIECSNIEKIQLNKNIGTDKIDTTILISPGTKRNKKLLSFKNHSLASNHSPDDIELSMSRFPDSSYIKSEFKIFDTFDELKDHEKLIKSKTFKQRIHYKNTLNNENFKRSNTIKENIKKQYSDNTISIKYKDITNDKFDKETIKLSRLDLCKPDDFDDLCKRENFYEFLDTKRSLRNNELIMTDYHFSLNLIL